MKETKPKKMVGYRNIEVEKIREPEYAVRLKVTNESVQELAESIQKIGLIEPIIVRQKGDDFEVIAGHRRLVACRLAGVKSAKCIVVDAEDTEAEAMKMHENYMRLDVSPLEQAQYFQYLSEKKGMKQSEIAELLGVSEGYVSQRMAILSWDEELVEALDAGQISFSSARELSRITDERTLRAYVRQAVEHGVTPKVANLWWRDWVSEKENVDLYGKSEPTAEIEPSAGAVQFQCEYCRNFYPYSELRLIRVCDTCGHFIGEMMRSISEESEDAARK